MKLLSSAGETNFLPIRRSSPCLVAKHCKLVDVKVHKVLRLMGDIRAEVAADYDVPKWRVSSVQLFLDEVGNVLLCVKSVHGCLGQFNHFALEHLIHVGILDLDLHCKKGPCQFLFRDSSQTAPWTLTSTNVDSFMYSKQNTETGNLRTSRLSFRGHTWSNRMSPVWPDTGSRPISNLPLS